MSPLVVAGRPPAGVLKRPLQGLTERIGPSPTSPWDTAGGVTNSVVQANWSDLEPSSPGNQNFSGAGGVGNGLIQTGIAWGAALSPTPGALRLRPTTGWFSPAWVKALADKSAATMPNGQPYNGTYNGNGPWGFTVFDAFANQGGTVGAWWTTGPGTYSDAWLQFCIAYARQYDSEATLRELSLSGMGSSSFAEVFLHAFYDSTQPGGISPAHAASCVLAGFTAAADQSALLAMIDNAAAYLIKTNACITTNPYHNMVGQAGGVNSGTGYAGPLTCSTQTSSAINVTGSGVNFGVNQFTRTISYPSGSGAAQSCVFLFRIVGKITNGASILGTAVLEDTATNFSTNGTLVGDQVMILGLETTAGHTVAGIAPGGNVNRITLNGNVTMPAGQRFNNSLTDLTSCMYFTAPAAASASFAYAVTSNTATQLSCSSLPTAGTLNGLNLVVVSMHPQNTSQTGSGDQGWTWTAMQYFRSRFPFGKLGNHSGRPNYKFSGNATAFANGNGVDTFYDLQSLGPPLYEQTASDSNVGGQNLGLSNPLYDVLIGTSGLVAPSGGIGSSAPGSGLLGARFNDVELPTNCVKWLSSFTSAAGATDFGITANTGGTGANAYGRDPGNFGVLSVAGGVSYWVYGNTTGSPGTFQLVGQQAGLLQNNGGTVTYDNGGPAGAGRVIDTGGGLSSAQAGWQVYVCHSTTIAYIGVVASSDATHLVLTAAWGTLPSAGDLYLCAAPTTAHDKGTGLALQISTWDYLAQPDGKGALMGAFQANSLGGFGSVGSVGESAVTTGLAR